jgi:hypothetical protein
MRPPTIFLNLSLRAYHAAVHPWQTVELPELPIGVGRQQGVRSNGSFPISVYPYDAQLPGLLIRPIFMCEDDSRPVVRPCWPVDKASAIQKVELANSRSIRIRNEDCLAAGRSGGREGDATSIRRPCWVGSGREEDHVT